MEVATICVGVNCIEPAPTLTPLRGGPLPPPHAGEGWGGGRQRTSAAARREEALRADKQYRRHQDVDRHRGERRAGIVDRGAAHERGEERTQIGAADRIDDADEERRDKGAADPMPPITMTTKAE